MAINALLVWDGFFFLCPAYFAGLEVTMEALGPQVSSSSAFYII